MKRKSQPQASTADRPTKRRCFRPRDFGNQPVNEATAADIERHVAEMKSQWSKPKASQSGTHLKALWKNTRQDRLSILAKDPEGVISAILDKYPCLEDGEYVSF